MEYLNDDIFNITRSQGVHLIGYVDDIAVVITLACCLRRLTSLDPFMGLFTRLSRLHTCGILKKTEYSPICK